MTPVVLWGPAVHHLLPADQECEAVAIDGKTIAAVGSRRAARAAAGTGATELRLDRGALLPGFVDAHHHGYLVVADPATDMLHRKASDIGGLLEFVRGKRDLPGGWLRLHGYEPLELAEMRSPTAREIDAVIADRPVHLISRTYHESSVNSLGLELLGYDRKSHKTAGVLRNRRGHPTGVLLEGASFVAEAASRPAIDHGLVHERLAWHVERLLAAGITTICDAAVPMDAADGYVVEAADLGMRVVPLVVGERIDTPILTAGRTAKVLADGGEYCHLCLTARQVGSLTAASVSASFSRGGRLARAMGRRAGFPTPDGHGRFRTGITVTGTREMQTLIEAAAIGDAKLAVHAIGNGAVRSVLDARNGARNGSDLPLRVEHAMALDLRDAELLAKAGLPVVAQPGFLDAFGHQLNAVPLPAPIRLMPFSSLLGAGVELAFSSDFPAANLNPWPGIASAVNRTDRTGRVILGEESISVQAAIAAYTTTAADVLGLDAGRIEPGAPADLVWVEPDPFTARDDLLARVETLATWSGGILRFAAAGSGLESYIS